MSDMSPPDRRNDPARQPMRPANGVAYSPEELASYGQRSADRLSVGDYTEDEMADPEAPRTPRIQKDYY